MSSAPNPSMEEIAAAMSSPQIKNSKPDQLIPNLMAMFGMDGVDPVTPEQCESIRQVYFQAHKLEKDNWTPMPDGNNIIQIMPFKLVEVPAGCKLVVDVLIDKSDFEAEVFDQYITNMAARGKSLIFYAKAMLPMDITVGLKCVDEITNEPIYVPDEMLQRA